MKLSFKSWKTKTAGVLIGASVFLATLPASAVLFTVGTIVVTPSVLIGACGAVLGMWGVSDKGDKIIKAIEDGKK
jgi:hypothetical protein